MASGGLALGTSSPLHDDRHKRNEFHPYVQGVLYVSVTNGQGRLLSRSDSVLEGGNPHKVSGRWSLGVCCLRGNTYSRWQSPSSTC
jgi:hypothetical protein